METKVATAAMIRIFAAAEIQAELESRRDEIRLQAELTFDAAGAEAAEAMTADYREEVVKALALDLADSADWREVTEAVAKGMDHA